MLLQLSLQQGTAGGLRGTHASHLTGCGGQLQRERWWNGSDAGRLWGQERGGYQPEQEERRGVSDGYCRVTPTHRWEEPLTCTNCQILRERLLRCHQHNDCCKILLVLVAKLHFHDINVLRHFNGRPPAVQLWGPMCCLRCDQGCDVIIYVWILYPVCSHCYLASVSLSLSPCYLIVLLNDVYLLSRHTLDVCVWLVKLRSCWLHVGMCN